MRPALFFSLLPLFVFPSAHAADPGDACTAGENKSWQVATTNPNIKIQCDGTKWRILEIIDESGAATSRIKQVITVGNDTATCNSDAEGTIRYTGGTPPWEYCDGSAWTNFKQPRCEDDATGECYLAQTRSGDDPDFIAANIKEGVNVLGVTGTLTPAEYVGTCPTSGLVANWKLDEVSGTMASDSVGSYHGTLTNMAPATDWVAGKISNGLDFDGDNDYVQISGLLGQPANFSISFWMNARSPQDSGGGDIVNIGDYIQIRISQYCIYTYLWNGSNYNGPTDCVNYLGSGWHHVVIIMDDTNNSQKIYVDGAQRATTSISSSIVWTGQATVTMLGRAPTYSDTNFNGVLDDVRVYNRALSADDVTALYNSGAGCDPLPCGHSPSVGQVCTDGTVYAGLSPDGDQKMYTTRCDAGMSWDGSACTGTRSGIYWNNGTTTYTNTNYRNIFTGKANTAGLAVLGGGGAPFNAAQYCQNLVADGHSDWYLPAREEVYVLWQGQAAIGGFYMGTSYPTFIYWSSTEGNNASPPTVSLATRFYDGLSNAWYAKDTLGSVRCVRK